MKTNVIRVAVAALLVCAAGTARAVPTDGGEWTIGAGETETLAAETTVLRLAVDGSLTLVRSRSTRGRRSPRPAGW